MSFQGLKPTRKPTIFSTNFFWKHLLQFGNDLIDSLIHSNVKFNSIFPSGFFKPYTQGCQSTSTTNTPTASRCWFWLAVGLRSSRKSGGHDWWWDHGALTDQWANRTCRNLLARIRGNCPKGRSRLRTTMRTTMRTTTDHYFFKWESNTYLRTTMRTTMRTTTDHYGPLRTTKVSVPPLRCATSVAQR